MTMSEIKKRVQEIEECSNDNERAHGLEDGLRLDFITFISNGGAKDIKQKAALVLQTEDMDFSRWCA